MATNRESYGHRCLIALGVGGLLLSASGILLQKPLLTVSHKCPDKISIFVSLVYPYLFLLNPLCFYLNMLLLLLHVSAPADVPEAPPPVFVISRLHRAAHTVSFATLFVSAPLSFLVAVEEKHVSSAIAFALVCLALITILTSVFKNFFLSSFRASRGVIPALFALCISTGYLLFSDPIITFSEKNHYNQLTLHTSINLLLLLINFFIFILGITLVILCIIAPTNGQHASIRVENLVIAALSVSFATLLVIWYIEV